MGHSESGEGQTREAMNAPLLRRVADRLPWLMAGLVGSTAASFVVSQFEDELESQVVVAFFIPAVVYLADAIGAQTVSIVVRGLSSGKHPPFWKMLLQQVATGLLNGLGLGALSFGVAYLLYQELMVGLAFGLAVVFAGITASSLGLIVPYLLKKLGKDPAFGSSPIATVIQDVISLLIYFLLVQLMT